ncbi:MAG: hypothetical protein HKL81_01945 [Acidimicrobiaceae bacterium]|nr:hypothetical protein [Acidimicrobiaceae bacterium]
MSDSNSFTYSSGDSLSQELSGGILWLTLMRPDRKNALNWEMLSGIIGAIEKASNDDSVRTIVITGGVGESFCSGVDLSNMATGDDFLGAHNSRGGLVRLFRAMWECPRPIVAEVDGYALAGGFGLASACDIVIASDEAHFGLPEVGVGVWPFIISVPLLRVANPRLVLEMMMTGRRIDANEALAKGFVNFVYPRPFLRDEVRRLTDNLASRSLATLALGKSSFYNLLAGGSQLELSYLHSMLGLINQTEDAREGIDAFLNRRPPAWKDR